MQAKESAIIVNAYMINEGKMPNLRSSQDKFDDFYFIEQEYPQKVMELIITLVKEKIFKRFGFNAIDDIQVHTSIHRGIVGPSNLNMELQKAKNPGDEGVSRFGRFYKINDKVMLIPNNYDEEEHLAALRWRATQPAYSRTAATGSQCCHFGFVVVTYTRLLP